MQSNKTIEPTNKKKKKTILTRKQSKKKIKLAKFKTQRNYLWH